MSRLCFLQVKKQTMFLGMAVALMIILFGIWGVEAVEDYELARAENQPAVPPSENIEVIINVSQRRLEVYENGRLYKQYRVAAGKMATPSPVGEWKIVYKSHSIEERFGTRWMGLDVPWGSYGIHGTNAPWSIGSFASGGCFRMGKKDVEELYEWLPLGTPVTVEGRRDKVHTAVHLNSMGQEVAILQLRLKALGYYSGRADGKFGTETQKSLERFQRINGLEQTGIADKKTINLLGI